MRKKKIKNGLIIALVTVSMLLLVCFTMFNFYYKIQEREFVLQMNSLKDLSSQGASVLEAKLDGFISTLDSLSGIFKEGEVHDEEKIEKLKGVIEDGSVEFQRMGVADSEGNSWITNGVKAYIGDKDYFIRCMNGASFAITENYGSIIVDKDIFIVSVPIHDSREIPRGILYGVVETDSFQIYKNTSMDKETDYMQIIDRDGEYILRQQGINLMTESENIFDSIEKLECKKNLSEIKDRIREGKPLVIEVSRGDDERVVYFSPLHMNEWYVVTVMKKSDVTASLKYLLDNDIYILIGEVLGVSVILTVVLLSFSAKERKRVEEMNQELQFNEKVFQITSSQFSYVIMAYEIESRRLRFLNQSALTKNVPRIIEDAPQNLLKYIPQTKDTKQQVETIFQNMGNGKQNQEFYVSIIVQGEERMFQVQETDLTDKKGRVTQCLALMKDVTEEVQLRKKADMDQLTGLFNRTGGIERIDAELKQTDLPEGVVHAFCIMDLDNFKTLNDTMGHQAGDKALKEIGRILKQHFREYDIVCRLGGDEFVVFLENIPREIIEKNIRSLLKKLHLRYYSKGKCVEISVSVGVALAPLDGNKFRDLYSKADRMLYEVKQTGKDGFKIYTEEEGKRK